MRPCRFVLLFTMQKISQHNGFSLHKVRGSFQGKVSGYFDSNGTIKDAEQIIEDRVRPIKRGGPIWKHLEMLGRIHK